MMGFFGWNPSEDLFLGFQPRYSAWTEDFERLKAINPDGVRFEIEADGVKEMEELLRLCKEQGIKVLLVYSPEYQEMQTLTTNRAQVFAHFDALRDQFGVPVWDYSNSPISARKQNFYNSQHLNADGAAMFSQEVGARIVSDPGPGNVSGIATWQQAEPRARRSTVAVTSREVIHYASLNDMRSCRRTASILRPRRTALSNPRRRTALSNPHPEHGRPVRSMPKATDAKCG